MAILTTALMAAFMPWESPPDVSMAIFNLGEGKLWHGGGESDADGADKNILEFSMKNCKKYSEICR